MSNDVRYGAEYWREAVEAAENNDWDPIDSLEGHGPAAQWIADDLYTSEKVGQDGGIIEAAIQALADKGETEFSAERLTTVVQSYRGETVDDWRTLAEEHAEENGVELVFLGGEPNEHDYHQWYMQRGVSEGEVYAPASSGGTLHWFDTNKW